MFDPMMKCVNNLSHLAITYQNNLLTFNHFLAFPQFWDRNYTVSVLCTATVLILELHAYLLVDFSCIEKLNVFLCVFDVLTLFHI